ncbi:MAG: putative metal-binding motif-containing protein, partial [Alphaproteobacteria bacterium]|nr:putative metal-binding motif-containing protein [Alphaproteobacteria bacterium]
MRTLTLLGALLALSACKGGDTPVDSSVPDDSGGGEVDADGDGVPAGEDCDDDDAGVYPGATELCDDVDNNCDGAVDEGLIGTFYQD